MEDSLIENEDHNVEHDSLSSDSFSKDSLLNGHHTDSHQPFTSNIVRRGSYTLATSPELSISIRNQHLSQPIYAQTNQNHRHSLLTNPSNSLKQHKTDMTQSMYERPWVSTVKNNATAKANAKQREEKLRVAKEEQDRKQKQKKVILSESEKIAERARLRKEAETLRKLEEMKKKTVERQRIVEERKERLLKAEEARRKLILRKLVNVTNKKPSPQSSNNMMTMSCYGGFDNARNRPGNKEVVHNRFLSNRPLSSTGKIMGFGSSTPRPICQNTKTINSENKRIPEAILLKCDILSRPLSSRMSDRMMTSVVSPPVSSTMSRPPQRQSSWREKDCGKVVHKPLVMTMSMIDYTPKNKISSHSSNKTVPKSDMESKNEMTNSFIDSRKHGENKTRAPHNPTKTHNESQNTKTPVPSKSGLVSKRMKKTRIDTHFDSDSIEEETSCMETRSEIVKIPPREKIMETSQTITNNDVNSQGNAGRAPPTKDLSESEYKARLMENRRMVREKREREREQLMKTERERRHAEEVAAREMAEMEREKNTYIEDSHFTTSNDDALDGPQEPTEYIVRINDEEEAQLSEIPEAMMVSYTESPQLVDKKEEEKNERKKKLDLIMSRIRKPNEESSSDGGVSPRRVISPEPAELEPEVSNVTSMPAFKSSLLQSMVNTGRLAKLTPVNKDNREAIVTEIDTNLINISQATILSSVRESIEDSESLITNINSPSSAAIRSSGIDGNSLSDANSEFAPEQLLETYEEEAPERDSTLSYIAPNSDREDCDGKEDSLSINESRIVGRMTINASTLNDANNCVSQSSTETEEEEIIKTSFEIESLYGSSSLKAVSQETCVFQN